MGYFAVTREAGPGWTDGQGAFQQAGVNDHGAFMNTLADEGLVVFAGPLAGTEDGRIRALLIANAPTEADIHRRLADDPWTRDGRLTVTSVESWTLVVGAERLAADHLAET
jgi:uncharacterized protein YciI